MISSSTKYHENISRLSIINCRIKTYKYLTTKMFLMSNQFKSFHFEALDRIFEPLLSSRDERLDYTAAQIYAADVAVIALFSRLLIC